MPNSNTQAIGLQWCIYDYFKIFMGLPTTGGPAAPEKIKN